MTSLLAALAFLADAKIGQTHPKNDPSLGIYLSKHPWDVAKRGPMLVVNAEETQPMSFGAGVAAYGRKEFALGSLTVIAPAEMVFIDASLNEAPNIYDGLPRTAKIFYLMSTLDPQQWKLACTSGIGLGDMTKDQRAVYQSILPSVFAYDNDVWGKRGSSLPNPSGPITLSADEEAGVRLHFFKEVELGIKTQEGGFSAVSAQPANLKKEGEPYLHRSDLAGEDRTSLFGVQVRKVLDNHLKPSDLNYRAKALDAPLALAKASTVADLCKSVASVCGLELIADTRIADLPIQTVGEFARSGDVLQALALSVTGTFRRVGESFVLTCDLEGIGAKRLKLATWKADLEMLTRRRVIDWAKIISTNGGGRQIGYRSDSPLPLNDAMAKFMDDDHPNNGSKTMLASQLPAEWQDVLNEGAAHRFGNTPMRNDVVFPYTEALWNFILPDGRPLEWEESLGQLRGLTHPSTSRDRSSHTDIAPIRLQAGSSSAVVFKTEDPSVATRLPELAQGHGFEEIWVQTRQLDCLKEAVRAAKSRNLKIRLMVRPWEIPDGMRSSDPDRSILGDTSAQAEARLEGTAQWTDGSLVWGQPPLAPGIFMGPSDELRVTVWKKLVDLSKTPGLDGIVLCDTEPSGYEPTMGNALFDAALLDLGYTQSLRRQFLSQNQVDPVDIVNRQLFSSNDKLDLSLPFFGDPMQASVDQPGGTLAKWMKLRADANREDVQQLVSQFSCPIMFQLRHNIQETITLSGYQVVPWKVSPDLPTSSYASFEEEGDRVPGDGYCLFPFGHPVDPALTSRLYDNLLRRIKTSKGMLAIDMSSMPVEEIPITLSQWFSKG